MRKGMCTHTNRQTPILVGGMTGQLYIFNMCAALQWFQNPTKTDEVMYDVFKDLESPILNLRTYQQDTVFQGGLVPPIWGRGGTGPFRNQKYKRAML